MLFENAQNLLFKAQIDQLKEQVIYVFKNQDFSCTKFTFLCTKMFCQCLLNILKIFWAFFFDNAGENPSKTKQRIKEKGESYTLILLKKVMFDLYIFNFGFLVYAVKVWVKWKIKFRACSLC